VSADVAVRVKGLVKRFGRFTAVAGIDLEVERGAIFGFLGANGAGKTTAIRMLCGLLKPTAGEAFVDGVDVVRRPEQVKSRIGYMAQKFSLYDDLSVGENIRFFADAYLVPRGRVAARRDEVLRSTDLVGQEGVVTKTLPVGIKQRLALACALVHEPQVLFLDEPTAGVDPLSRRAFWRQIHLLRTRGVTVFVTTHHLDEAENCTEVLFMQAGRSVGLGPPRRLREQADRGDRVEIEGVAAEVLRGSSRVVELTPMGATWHARLRSADDVSPLAAELGVEVRRIRPSLEDVFLDAIREEGAR
jgi:ABC-2 type transport system ATP-binding protein